MRFEWTNQRACFKWTNERVCKMFKISNCELSIISIALPWAVPCSFIFYMFLYILTACFVHIDMSIEHKRKFKLKEDQVKRVIESEEI
jgi:hypothetical protein